MNEEKGIENEGVVNYQNAIAKQPIFDLEKRRR